MSEKLISADVIKARLNNSMKVPANVWNDGYNAGLCRAETIINFAPAVDAVEVVRCRQCRFGVKKREHGEMVTYCGLDWGMRGVLDPDDFCSYGKEIKRCQD